MRIFFVSDTHGAQDLSKIDRNAVQMLGIRPDDLLIHCGDFGAPWCCEEDETLRYWRSFPCDVVVCLGNHENYDWIERQEMTAYAGGRVRRLGKHVFAPLLGERLTLFGCDFWFFPGAYSANRSMWHLGKTLFAQEMPEREAAESAIDRFLAGPPVDFIISHDGPRGFVEKYLGYSISHPSEEYFRTIRRSPDQKLHPGYALDRIYEAERKAQYWLFGHHHIDVSAEYLRCLFDDIAVYDTQEHRFL